MATLFLFLMTLLSALVFNSSIAIVTSRENLEIIIGGGGGNCNNEDCAPAPQPEPEPTECPPPPPPPPKQQPKSPPPPPPPPKQQPKSPPPPPPPPKQQPKSPPPPPPPPKQQPKSPPPSPPKQQPKSPPKGPKPPSSFFPFENSELQRSYGVIQKFKQLITSDPMGVTKTWKGSNVCAYRGFFCEPPPGLKERRIASIDFNGLKLANKDNKLGLSNFLDKFPDIAIFHANSNNFTGTVPSISHLRYIYELDLSNNKLSGDFPSTVLGGTQFTFLDLRFNFFSSHVPAQIFNLKLDVLFLNNNNFAENLPENLGSTTVFYLTLANNMFTGEIPRSIGAASAKLTEVLFLNNLLSGCLPYEIGLLNKATVFDAGGNAITGPIPTSFGCLAEMELLNLARNQLFGEVPEVVCELPDLRNLSLSFNYFTQVGPICRKLVMKGVVDLRMNCVLDLPGQRPAGDCEAFFKKPKFCARPESFRISPCNKLQKGKAQTPQRRRTSTTVSSSPSYHALTEHRHL